MRTALHFLLLCLLTAGCNKNQLIKNPDCGSCQATPDQTLNNAIAIYKTSAVRVLNPANLLQTNLYASYCNPEYITGKVTEGDTVLISGELHPACEYNVIVEVVDTPRLTVTAIRRK